MSYTICNVYSLPSTYAASSLRAQLYDSSNNAVGSEISTGFYKRMGSTTIFAHALTVPDSHVGWCDVYVAGASSVIIACIPINPQEVENPDVKTSTRGTSTVTTSDIDARLAAYDAPTKAELDTAQSTIIDAIPTPAEIDTELSDNHGDGSWEDTELTAIADAVLGRSVAYVEDTAGVYSIAGMILAAFKSSAPGTTWTIYKTDGTTTFATRTLTEDANANPVTGVS